MSSPVRPQDVSATIPTAASTLCDRFRALMHLPSLMAQWFEWAFDSAGEFTDAFKTMLKGATLPVGSVIWWPSNNIPSGWFILAGQELTRTDYPSLFSVLGTAWGTPTDATKFKLPDLRGKVPAGANGSSFPFGASPGAESVTLDTNQIPSHFHNCPGQGVDNALVPVAYFGGYAPIGNAMSFNTAATGGGGSHPNIQPTIVGHYIILY